MRASLVSIIATIAVGVGAVVPGHATALNPVNAQNTQHCVQSFEINGKSYCANTAVATTPALKGALMAEKNSFPFDGRRWRLGWWSQDPNQPFLEYVVGSETVDNWTELVTSQFFPGLQKRATPRQFMETMLTQMSNQGAQLKVRIISQSPNSVLYEWKIDNQPGENQDELDRIIMGPNGLHFLHYCSRPAMSADRRAAWIKILSQAKVKL